MISLLVIVSIAGAVNAQLGASDDTVKTLFVEKIDECKKFGFYQQMGYNVPNVDDDVIFKAFSEVYHNVASHNAAFRAGEESYSQEVNCFDTVDSTSLQSSFVIMTPGVNSEEMIGSFSDTPDEYDRREDNTTTPARAQGSCGSCWAFSGIAALESKYLALTGEAPDDVDFSEQQFLDCTYESTSGKDGCTGGWMTNTWIRLGDEEKSILYSETQRSYTKIDSTCDILEQNLPNAMSKVVMQYPTYKQVGDSSTAAIMGASTQDKIYVEGAVAIAYMVESSFRSYSSGIFNTECASSSVNHALTLIGYTQEYFITQNSWGSWWGEDGTVRLSRTSGNLCQMLSYTMWPLMECAWGTDTNTHKCVAKEPCGGCKNNGRCSINSSSAWYCDCLEGYTGDMCQTKEEEDKCEDMVCYNGGTCDSTTGECKCADGWTGEYCKEKEDDTACNKKCNGHKSECYWKDVNGVDVMKCKCPGKTYGKKCSETLDCDAAVDHKKCQKKKDKDEDSFNKKCKKVWGLKKCPVLCGHCPEATELLLPPLEFTNDS